MPVRGMHSDSQYHDPVCVSNKLQWTTTKRKKQSEWQHAAKSFFRCWQSLSWSNNLLSFMDPKFHHRFHTNKQPVPILSHMNPIHNLLILLRSDLILSIHPHLGLSSGLFPSGSLTKILDVFHNSSGRTYTHKDGYQSIISQHKWTYGTVCLRYINNLLFVFISAVWQAQVHMQEVSIFCPLRNIQILPHLHNL
jgi:hypothetical protein